MRVVRAERTCEVLLHVTEAEPVRPPDSREIRPAEVKLVYAGNGYVRVEVRGRCTQRSGTDGGYWSHIEGNPSDPGNPRDTSYAPEVLRELAARYAPPDFTAVS